MEFEVGKTYNIHHARKGKLTVAVTAINGEWVDVMIKHGVATMMASGNADKGPGETMTIRTSLVTIHSEVVDEGAVVAPVAAPVRVEPEFSTVFDIDNHVPMANWGKDHWSILAYINANMTETGDGFQVGYDPRMSHNRYNFRVMREQCPHPKRGNPTNIVGDAMNDKYSTRIIEDGEIRKVRGHDDWCSVQDLAAEGLFTVGVHDYDVGDKLMFSDKGFAIAAALIRHKQEGGAFADFIYISLEKT